MADAHQEDCPTCRGNGWVMYIFPEKEPRPSDWFRRGPGGERPRECPGCEDLPEED